MIEINTQKVPIKMWLDDIEESAMKQIMNLANLPFTFSHVAIMPDSHSGYGMPIGGVLALEDTIIPNAVGVDIGCGMRAIKTDLTEINKDGLVKIMKDIRKEIPVGFKHREKECDISRMPGGTRLYSLDQSNSFTPIICREFSSATKQLGTLGGGNHFIELQKGDDGYIWAMIHSGSRNLGKQVCDHYNRVAKELNSKWHTAVPKEWDLASLPVESEEGQLYIDEMNYCLDFAKANRAFMMETIKDSFKRHNGAKIIDEIDIHHNYASKEKHFGRDVWVHRKGATSADKGQIGIIPGSQGTSSYIVEGLGNMWSFKSCSHGAGRKMGRNEAKRQLNLEDEKQKLDSQGILHSVRNVNDLDEASGAYKDIDIVMENQKDLVSIKVKLKPLAVVKG
jgi:tRNA-splicing ligase RtcB (3'-phosphate/5'-hydroxy nucleic acid ligase)